MSDIRKAAVKGMFYPDSPDKLRDEIKLFLDITSAKDDIENITGLVVPHAGYIYSGKTAAFAFNLVKGKNYNKVIVISPSHREYFPGVSVYNGSAYETPLGRVPVNKELREKFIEGSKTLFAGVQGHGSEHAVEVQLPFLQTVLNEFTFLPVVMGDQGRMFIDELSSKLAEIMDDNTLLVASSDLSHYHTKGEAYHLDSIIEKHINDFDYDALYQDLEINNCEACGGGPIISIMKASKMKNKSRAKVLNRSDSGDVSGNDMEVVGYLSAAIYA